MIELPPSLDGFPARIIMVCMGNICRSPAAEVVLRQKLVAAGIDGISVDSAGTGGWHEGDDADPRSRAAWERRGYRGTHIARQFRTEWFDERDLILAMDTDNLTTLQARSRTETQRRRITLLRAFDPAVGISDSTAVTLLEVPDPYYGGPEGFEHMLDLIEAACDGLVARLQLQV